MGLILGLILKGLGPDLWIISTNEGRSDGLLVPSGQRCQFCVRSVRKTSKGAVTAKWGGDFSVSLLKRSPRLTCPGIFLIDAIHVDKVPR